MPDPEFITKSSLKRRGWNDKLIAELLKQPDQAKENWYYKSGPPVCLYEWKRVRKAEKSAMFRKHLTSRPARKLAAQKAVATKRARIQEYVESVKIEVPEMPDEELFKRACDSYNALHFCDRNPTRADPGCDPEFLHRITVNYLRHELTGYEEHLAKIAGKVDAREAYMEIKTKVLDAIGDQYADLLMECQRQIDRLQKDALNLIMEDIVSP